MLEPTAITVQADTVKKGYFYFSFGKQSISMALVDPVSRIAYLGLGI